MARMMDFCKLTILLAAFLKVGVCQKIYFNEPVTLDTGNGMSGQYGNWSLQGKITLTNKDLIIFKQKVLIQACNDICVVDLSQCSPKDVHGGEEDCYCKEKNGDEHSIHIGSTAKPSQSGARLTATIPSRDMFQPIAGMSVIGQLPYISTSKVKATYQVDDTPTKPLLLSQKIEVCADTFVTIKLCMDKRKSGSLIQVNIDGGQTILSGDVCVRFVEKYNFEVIPVYILAVSYLESMTVPEILSVFTISIQQNSNCNIPTLLPTTTPNQSIPVQSNLSQVVAESMSSLTKMIQSIKQEFKSTTVTINASALILASLERNQEQLKTLISGIGSLFNFSFGKHSYCSKEIGCEVHPNVTPVVHCYKLELESKVNWHDAVKRCQVVGGFLAEVHDNNILNYVKRLVAKSTPATEGVWLGASDQDNEGAFTWVTSGTNISITDWSEPQPDDYNQQEDCLEVRMNYGVKWNDAQCLFEHGYLCQKTAENCHDWMSL